MQFRSFAMRAGMAAVGLVVFVNLSSRPLVAVDQSYSQQTGKHSQADHPRVSSDTSGGQNQ